MPFAKTFVISGIGEPTIHPHFDAILDYARARLDPRCAVSLITNGDRILNHRKTFEEFPLIVTVSLNAATAETHHKIMRMGEDSLPRVIDGIRFLKSLGRMVLVSAVVTRDSRPEIPALIELANELKVAQVFLHTLLLSSGPTMKVTNPEYVDLPAILHPDFEHLRQLAAEAIQRSNVPVFAQVDGWGLPMRAYEESAGGEDVTISEASIAVGAGLPYDGTRNKVMTKGQPLPAQAAADDPASRDMGDPFLRTAPFSCDYVYYVSTLLNGNMGLGPCCYMPRVPGFEAMGFLASEDFLSLWNSPAMVTLRERLQTGPLYPACKTCLSQLQYG